MDWEYINLNEDFLSGADGPTDVDVSFHIVISDEEILSIDGAHPWRPLTRDEYRWLGVDEISTHYLGTAAGIPVFVNEVDPEAEEPEGYEFETLWSFLGRTDEALFSLLGRAKQVVDWYQNHQFCGQCGKPTGDAEADRSRKCDDCGNMFYPRLSPSIIVLITRGEEVLLAKNANARGDFYSTIAGFVEPGESIEEAVHREVREEVGVGVKNLQYFNSQSWPFPNSLMLGFHAEYTGGEIVLQEEEIIDARWFHYTEMPNRPAMVSISGWLIDHYIRQLESPED
jgi:NAD+ diphosphatase